MSGNSNMNSNPVTDMFGNMNSGNNNAMIGMQQQQFGMQQQQMGMPQGQMTNQNIMRGGKGANHVPNAGSADAEADDFGDFEDGNKTQSSGNVDPLSKLISLDGLSKNKPVEDKLNQPILVNDAAKAAIQQPT